MSKITTLVLQIIIAISLIGSVIVQVVILPLVWADLEGEAPWGRIALVALAGAGVVTLQVSAVCIWRLLTMVRRGSVFSPRAFRYVDVIIGAVASAALLLFVLACLLAPGEIAPGVVALVCGASLVVAGVALLVVVMRQLLAQAIARTAEATVLRSELDEVI
jgi:hypothetical protein